MRVLQVSALKRPVPIYVYPSSGEVTLFQDLDFKVKCAVGGVRGTTKVTIQSGYRSDMASVPVWYVALALAMLASSVPWALGLGSPLAGGLQAGLILFLALCLTLRKFVLFPAGIIHDALYDGKYDLESKNGVKSFDREEADRIFLLLVSSYCLLRLPRFLRPIPARIAWLGVRLFGGSRYTGKR